MCAIIKHMGVSKSKLIEAGCKEGKTLEECITRFKAKSKEATELVARRQKR
jgi:hypothetical protein